MKKTKNQNQTNINHKNPKPNQTENQTNKQISHRPTVSPSPPREAAPLTLDALPGPAEVVLGFGENVSREALKLLEGRLLEGGRSCFGKAVLEMVFPKEVVFFFPSFVSLKEFLQVFFPPGRLFFSLFCFEGDSWLGWLLYGCFPHWELVEMGVVCWNMLYF